MTNFVFVFIGVIRCSQMQEDFGL